MNATQAMAAGAPKRVAPPLLLSRVEGADASAAALQVERFEPPARGQVTLQLSHPGVGSIDAEATTMRLNFQIAALFRSGKIGAFWLADPATGQRVAPLQSKRMASPALAVRHADLAWAARSRFQIDDTVSLGAWQGKRLVVVASVGIESMALATIRVGD